MHRLVVVVLVGGGSSPRETIKPQMLNIYKKRANVLNVYMYLFKRDSNSLFSRHTYVPGTCDPLKDCRPDKYFRRLTPPPAPPAPPPKLGAPNQRSDSQTANVSPPSNTHKLARFCQVIPFWAITCFQACAEMCTICIKCGDYLIMGQNPFENFASRAFTHTHMGIIVHE